MTYKYETYRQAFLETNRLNKTAVFDALSAAGITAVLVSFDGNGDEGQIESVTSYAGETEVEITATPVAMQQASYDGTSVGGVQKDLCEAIETLCYDFLEQEHEGWEINDGSFGEFRFDTAKRAIELEFNQNHMSFETHEQTF